MRAPILAAGLECATRPNDVMRTNSVRGPKSGAAAQAVLVVLSRRAPAAVTR
jgi:hypothetical protein